MTPTRLRSYRLGLRLSQEELADRLGVEQTTVSEYERGASRIPADLATTVVRLVADGVTARRSLPLSRYGSAEVRDALVAAQWSVKIAAERLGVKQHALYAHVYKYLDAEWCARPRRRANQPAAAKRRSDPALHPWRRQWARRAA